MRCFEHAGREALGSCVGCGKGVCLDCLHKQQGRIYCFLCQPGSLGSVSSKTLAAGGLNIQINRLSSLERVSGSLPLTTVVSDKNRYLAAILALCAGSFGVHKFYLNQPLWGLMYLLFFWTGIPGMAGVIEGILYCVRSEEDFIRRYGYASGTRLSAPLVSQLQALPVTPKDYERFLLQFAHKHQGKISIALLLAEHDLQLAKVEDALARLTAKNMVESEIDDSGYVHYYVPEFRQLGDSGV